MADKILKFGIPKGSLEAQTLELLRKSGWRISVDARSYMPKVDAGNPDRQRQRGQCDADRSLTFAAQIFCPRWISGSVSTAG